ncbi:MAG TPA: transcription antitermination factor NusB [Hyphomicrobiaceae bacterium]|nr:transcription antitermination factor NusB [Hyphomicrobiaceae bacterium]
MSAKPPRPLNAPEGLAARRLAVSLVAGVLGQRRPLEQVLADLSRQPDLSLLHPRDRALARMVAATVLRRQGELEHVLNAFIERPLPASKGQLWPILLCAAAQLLCLEMPAHAVVDLSVELVRRDRGAHRFAKLSNAVLRRVSERGAALIAAQDAVRLNIPAWLWQRWSEAYGAATARRIAEASLKEAALDISLKPAEDPNAWAERLGGLLLPTGSLRLQSHGRIEDLPGYGEGAWWVQDAAAALVGRLAGEVAGRSVADLCAAPGGKTVALAAHGAAVTAVDISPARLERTRANLDRLRLSASLVAADVATWTPGLSFDVVILDAPCTATGTIRRHPDILRLKVADDVPRMAELQGRLLANAARLVKPDGLLLYSTCSLEPEEGSEQIAAFLAAHDAFRRVPVLANEVGGARQALTPAGELRTLPCHGPQGSLAAGMDGFYVARLRRLC